MSGQVGELTDKLNALAFGAPLPKGHDMPEQRIAAIEARLTDIIQTLRDMREDHRIAMAKIEQSATQCRERCDASRSAVYDRIRDIEGEQKVNRGAHQAIDTEKARHPHVHIAGATYSVFGITVVLVIVEVIKLLKG